MFEPENPLENSLIHAVRDPSLRPQFYRDLLAADIFVVSAGDEQPDVRDGVLKAGAKIGFQFMEHDGEDWLPIYTSLTRLQQNLRSEVKYLRLGARSFFQITKGANIMLNPGLDYGKMLPAAEIASLLDGSIFQPAASHTYQQETRVLLGQPAEYPTDLVRALSRLFAKHRGVRAAYLAHMHDPSRDEKPHTIIGIDAEEKHWQTILGDACIVARETVSDAKLIDFTRVSVHDAGLSQYMLHQTKPFYRRSLIRRLFG